MVPDRHASSRSTQVQTSILQTLRCSPPSSKHSDEVLHPPHTQVQSSILQTLVKSSSILKMEPKAACKIDFLKAKHNLINHVLHNIDDAICSQQCLWAMIQNKFFHYWVVSVKYSVTMKKENNKKKMLLESRVLSPTLWFTGLWNLSDE